MVGQTTPGMSFGGQDPSRWVNDIPQDQLVTASKHLLNRIANDPTLKQRFTDEVKGDRMITSMLGNLQTT